MNEMRDRIAALQHEIWAHWMRYMFACCEGNNDGSMTIPADKVARWRRQIDTSYSELTDKERESDLEQADKIMKLLS